jgi:hypothetical protein
VPTSLLFDEKEGIRMMTLKQRLHKRAYQRRWYKENKARQKATNRKWRYENQQRHTALEVRYRAKNKGIPCDFDYLVSMKCPRLCPVFLTSIAFTRGRGHLPRENTASFDQIIPGKGYIRGNVQIISLKANMAKSNLTPAQLLLFSKWVLAQAGT